MRKLLLLLSLVVLNCVAVFAQSQTITGTVLGDDGQPTPGVAVMVKGTTIGTVTDFDGKYVLNVPADATALVYKFIGYEDQEQEIMGRTTIDVNLVSDIELLEDVIVVAYGSAKRGSLTGSVSQIDSKKIENRISTSVTSALEGAAPGVRVNNAVGQPGSEPSIRVRGIGTVNGDSEPLYVVDGVPFNGNISDLNSNDIETVSVLKDASSSALYGNRAANGVVLITTKKAKFSDVPVVTLTINQGAYTRGIKEYERLDADEWMEVQWLGMKNYALSTPSLKISDESAAAQYASSNLISSLVKRNIYDAADDKLFDGNGNLTAKRLSGYDDLDWYDAVERTGHRQEYGVSYTSFKDTHNLFASLSYLNEEGYLIHNAFERLTARVNSQITPRDWLKLAINVYGTKQHQNYNSNASGTAYANPFHTARYMAPVYPVYLHNDDGSYALDEFGNKQYDLESDYLSDRHVVYELKNDKEKNERYTLDGTALAVFTIPGGFEVTLKGNENIRLRTRQKYNNPKIGDGRSNNGRLADYEYRYKTTNLQQQLTWNKDIDVNHIDVLLGHESYNYKTRSVYGMNTDMGISGLYVMSNFTTNSYFKGSEDEDATESFLGRVRFNNQEKYFLDASFRRDGSSRFSEDKRWGTFWSVGGSWDMSSEDFIKSIDKINYLKVRLSYGQVGSNKGINEYAYQALYELSKYGGSSALVIQQLSANDLEWEKTNNVDAAVEGRVFGRVNFTVGYFNRVSKDLLLDVPQPSSAGSYIHGDYKYMTQFQNAGTLRNKGWELSFDCDIIKGGDWTWNLGIDATFLKNEFEKLYNNENIMKGSFRCQGEGHPINSFYTYHFEGVDQMTGRSLYTIDEDLVASAEKSGDLVTINGQNYTTSTAYSKKDWSGKTFPDVDGSIHTDLKWKNLSLNVLTTYSIGGKIYDDAYQSLMSTAATSARALHKDILNSWREAPAGMTPDSPNRIDKNGIPEINHANSTYNNAGACDRWLVDASYFAMKNITLSYSLPEDWMGMVGLQSVVLKGGVEEVFTITKRQGLNPQYSFNGIQDATYVPARRFNIGAVIKF